MPKTDASASLSALTALSPLDGRYRSKLEPLAAHFSEAGLIRERIRVELVWLKALSDEQGIGELSPFSASARALLDEAVAKFDVAQAERVKVIGPPEGATRLRVRRALSPVVREGHDA